MRLPCSGTRRAAGRMGPGTGESEETVCGMVLCKSGIRTAF